MTPIKPKKTVLRWQWCKHCDCNIPGDMFDLRVHLVEDHKMDAWLMLDEDVRDEYKFEVDVRDHNLKLVSKLD